MDDKGLIQFLEEVETAYRALHFQWLIANGTVWLAADAFHRHDSPRDTETDDVHEWRTQAEETEQRREAAGMNSTPLILTKLQAAITTLRGRA